MKILDRYETLAYILNLNKNGERIVFSRYGDGEYLLMTKKKRCANEDFDVGELLKRSIKKRKQIICTVLVKKNYDELLAMKTLGKWGNTQKFMIEESGQYDVYGVGAFLRADYLKSCKLIPHFFKGRVLIVTGHHKEAAKVFKKENINVTVYPMRDKKASIDYEESKQKLIKLSKKYDNIVFSCGPIGKVLISDLIDVCDANLIDFGSMLNVVLVKYYKDITGVWSISWAKNINRIELADMFFNNIRDLRGNYEL